MNTLDSEYIEEQNKLASAGAWIWLVEITPSGGGATIRYTNNTNAVTWPSAGGDLFSAIPMTIEDVATTLDGKLPEYKVVIGELVMSSPLRSQISSSGGLTGSMVRLRIVHSDHLDLTTPAIDETAQILNAEVTLKAVTVLIGIPNLTGRRFPKDRYVPGFCRHKFTDSLCRYVIPKDSDGNAYSITSNQIQFNIVSEWAPGAPEVNKIVVAGEDLVQSIFRHALPLGTAQGANWALAKNTGFTVSGSLSNDGFFLAHSFYAVIPTRVYTAINPAVDFVEEAVGEEITITLGYNACDYSLNACAKRDNLHQYGGSPGIMGGVYG